MILFIPAWQWVNAYMRILIADHYLKVSEQLITRDSSNEKESWEKEKEETTKEA